MKRTIGVVVCCLLVLLLSNCQRPFMKLTLTRMMNAQVVLPDTLLCLQAGVNVPIPDSFYSSRKLIIYIDSTECSNCRISRLYDYSALYNLSRETGKFDLAIMVSSPHDIYMETVYHIQKREFPFPVYMDVDSRFLSINKNIPSRSRYHSISVDEHGKIIFVGDPTRGAKLMQMFKRINNISV